MSTKCGTVAPLFYVEVLQQIQENQIISDSISFFVNSKTMELENGNVGKGGCRHIMTVNVEHVGNYFQCFVGRWWGQKRALTICEKTGIHILESWNLSKS